MVAVRNHVLRPSQNKGKRWDVDACDEHADEVAGP
jgi:hypothetical protein